MMPRRTKLYLLTIPFLFMMISFGFGLFNKTSMVSAHHESCLSLTNPDRIVECSQQQLRIEMNRCETAHRGSDTGIRTCQDAALQHQGISAGSSNDPRSVDASTGSAELDKWLNRGVNTLSAIVGLVIVGSIIMAGIQYMTAQDNSSQVSAAKNRILMAVVALLLYLFGFTFLQWLIPGGIF